MVMRNFPKNKVNTLIFLCKKLKMKYGIKDEFFEAIRISRLSIQHHCPEGESLKTEKKQLS